MAGFHPDCLTCTEWPDKEALDKECPASPLECGHHCNHSWTEDVCCWCNKEFGEEPLRSPHAS